MDEFADDAISYDRTVRAKPGEYPDDYAQESNAWRAAYDHAAGRGNSVKASVLYAHSHAEDHEESSLGQEAVQKTAPKKKASKK